MEETGVVGAGAQRRYTDEFKAAAVERFNGLAEEAEEGLPATELASELGVSRKTLLTWPKADQEGPQPPEPSRATEFRLVEQRTLEQLGADGTWKPYPNNAFRALLDRPAFDLGELARLLTEPSPKEEEPAMDTPLRMSDRLAQISKRQMGLQAAIARPVVEEKPMEEVEGSGNGAAKRNGKAVRTRYTDEYKAQMAAGFDAAASKKVFAAQVGIGAALLNNWRNQWKAGKEAPEKAGPTEPPKPAKVRSAKPDADLDTELEVLRQLLNLPADARDRIVAYLTARGR